MLFTLFTLWKALYIFGIWRSEPEEFLRLGLRHHSDVRVDPLLHRCKRFYAPDYEKPIYCKSYIAKLTKKIARSLRFETLPPAETSIRVAFPYKYPGTAVI